VQAIVKSWVMMCSSAAIEKKIEEAHHRGHKLPESIRTSCGVNDTHKNGEQHNSAASLFISLLWLDRTTPTGHSDVFDRNLAKILDSIMKSRRQRRYSPAVFFRMI
jgi:hypothetical protein